MIVSAGRLAPTGALCGANRGIDLSRGELIQFLDADDLLDSVKVNNHLSDPSAYRHKAVTICYGRQVNFDGSDRGVIGNWSANQSARAVIVDNVQTPAPLHRKEDLLGVGGFSTSLQCCQEKDLHLRLLLAGIEFIQLGLVGYTYRWTRGGLSSNHQRVYLQLVSILWGSCQNLTEEQLAAGWDEFFAEALAANGRRLWKLGCRKDSLAAFSRARVAGSGRIRWPYGSRMEAWTIELLGVAGRLIMHPH